MFLLPATAVTSAALMVRRFSRHPATIVTAIVVAYCLAFAVALRYAPRFDVITAVQ